MTDVGEGGWLNGPIYKPQLKIIFFPVICVRWRGTGGRYLDNIHNVSRYTEDWYKLEIQVLPGDVWG